MFGSRLNASDPKVRKERLDALRRSSRRVMGVLVPPKPEEPDNCCMSGCVNCVYETFREEMELWADANREVTRRKMLEKRRLENEAEPTGVGLQQQSHDVGAANMDDDGGGNEGSSDELGNPAAPGNLWDDSLYQSLPVGIREFMKLEKRLRANQKAAS